jgi:hypothetical protein
MKVNIQIIAVGKLSKTVIEITEPCSVAVEGCNINITPQTSDEQIAKSIERLINNNRIRLR